MKMKPENNQLKWGFTAFLVIVCSMIAYYVIFDGRAILDWLGKMVDSISGIILGLIIAFILIPILDGIENKFLMPIYKKKGYDVSFAEDADRKKRKHMRAISVLLTIVFFIFIIYLLISIIFPSLIASIGEIINNLPVYIKNIDEYSNRLLENNPELNDIINSQLDEYYENLSSFVSVKIKPMLPEMGTIVRVASQSAISVIGTLLDFIIGIIVAVYVLFSKEKFSTRGKKMAYAFFSKDFANELVGGFRFIGKTFENFIGGKLVDSLIIGIICYVGCLILNINYPMLVSVIVGVTNIIPFFGPYIGGAAGALLLILIDPIKALIFLIFVVCLQQFDGNFLGPRILGSSTGLESFWVIFAITFFGGMWGVLGWLVGVPTFAVFYAFISRLTNHYLAKRGLSTQTKDYYDLAYIEDGEFKLLSDKANTKYNAQKATTTLQKIFGGSGKKNANKADNNKKSSGENTASDNKDDSSKE